MLREDSVLEEEVGVVPVVLSDRGADEEDLCALWLPEVCGGDDKRRGSKRGKGVIKTVIA